MTHCANLSPPKAPPIPPAILSTGIATGAAGQPILGVSKKAVESYFHAYAFFGFFPA